MADLYLIVLRSLAVYLFIVISIRVFGKRELTQLSVIDLVFILLISNAVQNAMVGPNTTLLGGLIAATSLFLVNAVLDTLFFKSRRLSKLLQGESIMLIYKGHVLMRHLDKAKLSLDDLKAAVREHGVESIGEVDLAVLENDGNISVLSNNYQHRTSKKRHAHKAVEKNL
jgi:uncharacterized membrane protein YcaP (DUF421 family)